MGNKDSAREHVHPFNDVLVYNLYSVVYKEN